MQDFHWIKQERSPNFELIGIEEEKEEKLEDLEKKYDTVLEHKEQEDNLEKNKDEKLEDKKLTMADFQIEKGQQMVYDYAKPLTEEEIMKKKEEDMKKFDGNQNDDENNEEKTQVNEDGGDAEDSSEDEI